MDSIKQNISKSQRKKLIFREKAVLRYNTKYNNTAKRVLNFLTPTEKIKEFKMMV